MNRTPLQQLAAWIDDAQAARLAQSDAMTLATASADGVPSARIVLLTAWTTAAPRWDWSAPSPAEQPQRAERGVDAEHGVQVLAGVSSKSGLRKSVALVTLARNCHAVVDWLAATAGG